MVEEEEAQIDWCIFMSTRKERKMTRCGLVGDVSAGESTDGHGVEKSRTKMPSGANR